MQDFFRQQYHVKRVINQSILVTTFLYCIASSMMNIPFCPMHKLASCSSSSKWSSKCNCHKTCGRIPSKVDVWVLSLLISCPFGRTQLGYNRDNIYLGYRGCIDTKILLGSSSWKDASPKYLREMGLDKVGYPDIVRNKLKKRALSNLS